MAIKSTTLRPGLLVSLKTSLTGNVQYDKTEIEPEKMKTDGAAVAAWKTTRTIFDPEEHDRAQKARSKAASLIRGVCSTSAFGLLCPEADSDTLERAVSDARAVAAEFNAGAKLSRISVYVITGRIAPDDVEAVKAINSEIADLMKTMADGIQNLDVKAVREAASRAKDVGAMLPAETAARVQLAVDAARTAARQIVKAGEQASEVIDMRAIRMITDARVSFLDLDANGNDVAAPIETGRSLDLAPTPIEIAAAGDYGAPQIAFEL